VEGAEWVAHRLASQLLAIPVAPWTQQHHPSPPDEAASMNDMLEQLLR
jgi:hypothetical protein